MKIKVNRNIVWARLLVEQLISLGVKNASISPGSRSTPLTYALASNNRIKCHIMVDERSSAFFALGIAKQTGSPVLVVTTSGTAAAELYPAIIEAYQSRVPLIIATADRPPHLRNMGANQTINQKNIFKNHIRYSCELPMPAVEERPLNILKQELIKAFNIAAHTDRGPVHLNIPFDKPFEPDNFTDIITDSLIKKIAPGNTKKISAKPGHSLSKGSGIIKKITVTERGIIFCGSGYYSYDSAKLIAQLSNKTGYPVIADGAAGLRFGMNLDKNIIENFSRLCASSKFAENYSPRIIIQFGAAPTSASMLDFFKSSHSEKYLINEFGDWTDPSGTAKKTIPMTVSSFCSNVLKLLGRHKASFGWFNKLKVLDFIASNYKADLINNAPFPFEGRIVNEIISSLPGECNLIISNSLPVRDFDSYAPVSDKKINVFTNRGASGIDGLISTALGIASRSELPSYLITGDLAFYHDLNALAVSGMKSIPLRIILINNNGGGIFEHLPIAKHKNVFEFFKTPLNLNFGNIVKGYGLKYKLIKNWKDLRGILESRGRSKSAEVFEIKTDSSESLKRRNLYQTKIQSIIE